jgi:hypothetical protein
MKYLNNLKVYFTAEAIKNEFPKPPKEEEVVIESDGRA